MQWIKDIAEKLTITATTEYKDIKAFDSPDDARIFWKKRRKIANFLKHAYFGGNKLIRDDEIDNLQLLMLAVFSYTDINFGMEGDYQYATFVVKYEFFVGLPEGIQQIVDLPRTT